MGNYNYHVKHKNSNVVSADTRTPKLPLASDLEYGEIAVNYGASGETLSIKNSNDEIITFSCDNRFNETFEVIAQSLNDLNSRLRDKADKSDLENISAIDELLSDVDALTSSFNELSAQTAQLITKIENNDVVIAAAFNDINDRLTALES